MKYIDLHVHSCISDGTLTPSELVIHAADKNLTAIALTDHDTILGINEAQEASKRLNTQGIHIELIPGVEISAGFGERDIHILGLFVDHTNVNLRSSLERAVLEREKRNEQMASNLRDAGIEITIEELHNADKKSILTRAHFAKLLYKKGYVKTIKDAFVTYLNEKGAYYVARKYISPEDSIALIKEAGGIPILAHPLLYHLNEKQICTLLTRLKSAGLAGIEAIYSGNVNNEESYVRSLARKYELLISGGSDFHGTLKPDIEIGIGRGNLKIPYELLDSMEKYRLLQNNKQK
ncbi:MAG: PHP domain-containing protein [Velocimicrobium sp.]